MSKCDRCQQETFSTIMSMFNTDTLCPACKKLEEQHPDYRKAVQAEHSAVVAGNFNFPGIGLPPDLSPRL